LLDIIRAFAVAIAPAAFNGGNAIDLHTKN